MTLINANIDNELLKQFRDVIYRRRGLRKGDFKDSVEEVMLDFIIKYSNSDSAKEFAVRVKAERISFGIDPLPYAEIPRRKLNQINLS